MVLALDDGAYLGGCETVGVNGESQTIKGLIKHSLVRLGQFVFYIANSVVGYQASHCLLVWPCEIPAIAYQCKGSYAHHDLDDSLSARSQLRAHRTFVFTVSVRMLGLGLQIPEYAPCNMHKE